mmetsp:Transcript_36590/g.35383  ORF Transcript_36590/g.35383 Transcript_36590/m.35383 type:complete len:236 (-) Transcript_36590:78-785(-)
MLLGLLFRLRDLPALGSGHRVFVEDPAVPGRVSVDTIWEEAAAVGVIDAEASGFENVRLKSGGGDVGLESSGNKVEKVIPFLCGHRDVADRPLVGGGVVLFNIGLYVGVYILVSPVQEVRKFLVSFEVCRDRVGEVGTQGPVLTEFKGGRLAKGSVPMLGVSIVESIVGDNVLCLARLILDREFSPSRVIPEFIEFFSSLEMKLPVLDRCLSVSDHLAKEVISLDWRSSDGGSAL